MVSNKLAAAITFIITLVILMLMVPIDYSVSVALVNPSLFFGWFIATFGVMPGYLVMIVALYIYSTSLEPSGWRSFIYLVAIIIQGIVIFILFNRLLHLDIFVNAGITIVLSVLIFAIMQRRHKLMHPDAVKLYWAKLTLFVGLFGPTLIVGTIKFIWGRVRYRDLISKNQFTNWYVINGINGNESFPSGHTAMGWMLLPFLVVIRPKKARDLIMFAVVFLWGIAVAVGRIVYGAHYLTDVTASTGLMICLLFLAVDLIEKPKELQH